MRELALFAGGGGGIWASLLLGHTTVCAVEVVEANRRMLLQRQLDGIFPRFPIWDDVRTFDGNEWRGKIDIVSGGFPCQDISCAGKGSGIDGERSGLWSEMARIIGEIRPRYAFIENSPMLIVRGLDRVLCDLAAMGFDAQWGVLGASAIGATQHRERVWILANTDHQGCKRTERQRQQDKTRPERKTPRCQPVRPDCRPWPPGPCEVSKIPLDVDGVAGRSHQLRAIGNGQIPAVAEAAWRILSERSAQ
ncbi:MAG: DNA cytosine methyltransferase [Zoogloea sp.]|nr:DNA cytosine methyltransferase [Zoogloea sp.]